MTTTLKLKPWHEVVRLKDEMRKLWTADTEVCTTLDEMLATVSKHLKTSGG